MRIITAAGSALASAGLLTTAWQLGSAPVHPVSSAGAGQVEKAAPATAHGSGTTAAGKKRAKATRRTPAAARTVVSGSLVPTRYGDVRVSVVVKGGRIVDVLAKQLTDSGGHSVQLSASAAPVLRREVLTAQSTRVDSVSGATYTSQAYLESAQAAIDAAHL